MTITDLATGDIFNVASGAFVAAATTGFIATAATSNDAAAANVVITANDVGATIDMSLATGTTGYTINGGNGNDILTGSAFTDFITGGAGNDTIKLVAGGVDTVICGATSALNGSDTITGFTAGEDKLNVDALTADTAVSSLASGSQVLADKVYFLASATAGNADSAAAVSSLINNTGATDNTVTTYFFVNDDNSSSLWSYTAASLVTGFAASELTLMSTIDAKVVATDLQFTPPVL